MSIRTLMSIAVATYPRFYVRPMEKHELAFVTSTCTMSCNVLLHDCTRHMSDINNEVVISQMEEAQLRKC
jgi:chorismate mutase